jgi:hypothetical protein
MRGLDAGSPLELSCATHAEAGTKVPPERGILAMADGVEEVNECIEEVLSGQIPARIVFQL